MHRFCFLTFPFQPEVGLIGLARCVVSMVFIWVIAFYPDRSIAVVLPPFDSGLATFALVLSYFILQNTTGPTFPGAGVWASAPVIKESSQSTPRLKEPCSCQQLHKNSGSHKDQYLKYVKVSIKMKKISSGIITSPILVLFVLFSVQPLFAADLRVIKISPQDERAVVRIDKRDLQIIEVGDALQNFGRVIQIAPGRIVLETEADNGTELVIIRLKNGQHNIERIRKGGAEATVLQAPQSNRQQ
jgi:hypothetical protein